MKNLLKIFMTVVAGMMAFSCATDTTDDLGVNLGKGQKTVISASLEDSRTYLGGYNEDAKKYPMYWSAEDKISANGVVSEETVISEANGAVASFEFPANANLKSPYFVAYPAVANAEGDWQVKFAAEQNWTEKNDTFDEGVSTMYGYSEEGLNVQMNHLTGILKIGVVLPEDSENVSLIKAQISTVDRKPIAGTFDFAFEKDAEGNILTDEEGNNLYTLTPTADAVSVIEYKFGEGEFIDGEYDGTFTELSTTPTYIHVAVPAGVYGELYVTLHDTNGGVMYATVTAGDSKPLAAGKVREFKKNDVEQLIEYVPLASDVTVIKTKSDLTTWAAKAAAQTVVLANDIDMKGESWSPVENFTGTFNGNGYAIKGLTAPLFGTTSATIKGLHLENVTITANTDAVGALVCTYTGKGLSNCSASGTITSNSQSNIHYIGGLIGFGDQVPAHANLRNDVNITISGTISGENNICIGGIAGHSVRAGSNMTNCINNGKITFDSTTNISTTKTVYVAGLVGFLKSCSLYNCENNGAIEIAGTISVSRLTIGGVVGDFRTHSPTIENVTNNGPITFKSGSNITQTDDNFPIGGIVGFYNGEEHANFINSTNGENGDITVESGASLSSPSLIGIGGIIGYVYSGGQSGLTNGATGITKNLTNRGDIVLGGTFTYLYVGGGTARNNIPVGASAAGEENDGYKNYGAIKVTSTATTDKLFLGGTVGFRARNDADIRKCYNYGPITLEGTHNGAFNVGGVFGYIDEYKTNTAKIINDMTNFEGGTITIKSGIKCLGTTVRIGGCLGYGKSYCQRFRNEAKITVEAGAELADGHRIGGVAGTHAHVLKDSTNKGDIDICIEGADGNTNWVGGIIGEIIGTNGKSNNKVFCNVKAIGYTNVGMYTVARPLDKEGNLKGYDGACGGRIATTLKDGQPFYRTITETLETIYDEEHDIYIPDPKYVPYYEVIYGTPITAEQATTDSYKYWDGTEE